MSIDVMYDYQAFSMQSIGGVSRYYTSLIDELENEGVRPHLRVLFSANRYLREDLGADPNELFHQYRGRGCGYLHKVANVGNKQATRQLFSEYPGSIYHPTYFDPWFLSSEQWKKGCSPLVVTVHDMIHELFPGQSADTWTVRNKRFMMNHADAIIAVSYSTKKDIIALYPELEGKVSVIHHGSSFLGGGSKLTDAMRHSEASIWLAGDTPYLLFVGSRRAYKNFDTFMKACVRLFADYPDLQLVCAGGGAFTAEEKLLFAKQGSTSRVTQIYASDEELADLYQGAALFVFPSRYEGFGLPVLEAMGNGAPCLLSNASSLPEVGGDAALYFDPDNVEELYRQSRRILDDVLLRAGLIQAGFRRATHFTWQKTAQQHAELYRSLTG